MFMFYIEPLDSNNIYMRMVFDYKRKAEPPSLYKPPFRQF